MIKKTEVIWIVLIIFTIFAYLLGRLELISSALVGVLLVTTFIKGQLIIDYFMGMKNVAFVYRVIPMLWLVGVIASIAFAYYY